MPKHTLEEVRRTIEQVKSVKGTMKGREYRKFLKDLYQLEKEIIRENSDKGKVLDFNKEMEARE